MQIIHHKIITEQVWKGPWYHRVNLPVTITKIENLLYNWKQKQQENQQKYKNKVNNNKNQRLTNISIILASSSLPASFFAAPDSDFGASKRITLSTISSMSWHLSSFLLGQRPLKRNVTLFAIVLEMFTKTYSINQTSDRWFRHNLCLFGTKGSCVRRNFPSLTVGTFFSGSLALMLSICSGAS